MPKASRPWWVGNPIRLGWRLWVGGIRETWALAAAIICMAAPSTWLMVFALGLMEAALVPAAAAAAAPGPATLFFRTRPAPGVAPLALSRRLRGRDDGVVVWCSFCWCRKSRSRRAKHREHSGHSNGFSLVCDRSWRFRCSSRANERWHVPQMCGRGLSVFGGGKLVVGVLVLTMMVEALKSKKNRSSAKAQAYHIGDEESG